MLELSLEDYKKYLRIFPTFNEKLFTELAYDFGLDEKKDKLLGRKLLHYSSGMKTKGSSS